MLSPGTDEFPWACLPVHASRTSEHGPSVLPHLLGPSPWEPQFTLSLGHIPLGTINHTHLDSHCHCPCPAYTMGISLSSGENPENTGKCKGDSIPSPTSDSPQGQGRPLALLSRPLHLVLAPASTSHAGGNTLSPLLLLCLPYRSRPLPIKALFSAQLPWPPSRHRLSHWPLSLFISLSKFSSPTNGHHWTGEP